MESTSNFGVKKVSGKEKEDKDASSGHIFDKLLTVIKSIQR